jgi:hypothetical protein
MAQMDKKNESKTNLNEETVKKDKIPVHTANFGAQHLN